MGDVPSIRVPTPDFDTTTLQYRAPVCLPVPRILGKVCIICMIHWQYFDKPVALHRLTLLMGHVAFNEIRIRLKLYSTYLLYMFLQVLHRCHGVFCVPLINMTA
jgi:hypothetical protein